MLIAKLNKQNKVTQIADYTEFGGFDEVPSNEVLKELGFRKVNQWRAHSKKSEKLVPCEPILEEPWVYTVKVQPLSSDEIKKILEENKALIKKQRNILLAESDWIYLPDASITVEEKNSWAEYRKAVKEAAATAAYIDEVRWPNKPE